MQTYQTYDETIFFDDEAEEMFNALKQEQYDTIEEYEAEMSLNEEDRL